MKKHTSVLLCVVTITTTMCLPSALDQNFLQALWEQRMQNRTAPSVHRQELPVVVAAGAPTVTSSTNGQETRAKQLIREGREILQIHSQAAKYRAQEIEDLREIAAQQERLGLIETPFEKKARKAMLLCGAADAAMGAFSKASAIYDSMTQDEQQTEEQKAAREADTNKYKAQAEQAGQEYVTIKAWGDFRQCMLKHAFTDTLRDHKGIPVACAEFAKLLYLSGKEDSVERMLEAARDYKG